MWLTWGFGRRIRRRSQDLFVGQECPFGNENVPSENASFGIRLNNHFAFSLAAFASSFFPSAKYELTICTYAATASRMALQ